MCSRKRAADSITFSTVEMLPKGKAALITAAASGRKDLVSQLLDEGADIDVMDERGTALIVAAASGNEDIVSLLLSQGATTDMVESEAGSALSAAAFGGHTSAATKRSRHPGQPHSQLLSKGRFMRFRWRCICCPGAAAAGTWS